MNERPTTSRLLAPLQTSTSPLTRAHVSSVLPLLAPDREQTDDTDCSDGDLHTWKHGESRLLRDEPDDERTKGGTEQAETYKEEDVSRATKERVT